MLKRLIAIILSILSVFPFFGNRDLIKVKLDPLSEPLEEFGMQNVTLLDKYEQNAFDKEAQEIAFNKTLNAVMAILSEDAKAYIRETSGDLTFYLTQQIEIKVNKTKNSIA